MAVFDSPFSTEVLVSNGLRISIFPHDMRWQMDMIENKIGAIFPHYQVKNLIPNSFILTDHFGQTPKWSWNEPLPFRELLQRLPQFAPPLAPPGAAHLNSATGIDGIGSNMGSTNEEDPISQNTRIPSFSEMIQQSDIPVQDKKFFQDLPPLMFLNSELPVWGSITESSAKGSKSCTPQKGTCPH